MFVGKYSDGSDALSYHSSQLVDILDFSLGKCLGQDIAHTRSLYRTRNDRNAQSFGGETVE